MKTKRYIYLTWSKWGFGFHAFNTFIDHDGKDRKSKHYKWGPLNVVYKTKYGKEK